MMNVISNLVLCECDIDCELAEPISLCGNDGVTYSSLCHLKQTKCLQQRQIKILNHNSCGNYFKLITSKNKALSKIFEKTEIILKKFQNGK